MSGRLVEALLVRGRFRIHPLHICMAFLITLCTIGNSLWAFFQRLIYGRRIAATEITQPPIFIIGHSHSGTTHLHELMVRDRLAYPTYYECFEPNHCLVTGSFLHAPLAAVAAQAPMDNMATGWDRPQEDEFALVAMGSPTPYIRMAFPNEPPPYSEFLDMNGCTADFKALAAQYRFVQLLTLKKNKRLIMKSPPHTGRIEELAKLFRAQNSSTLCRNPRYPAPTGYGCRSTGRKGCSIPNNRELDEYVFACFERMYRGLDAERNKLEPSQLCELKYEDLVRDPLGQLQQVTNNSTWGISTLCRRMIPCPRPAKKLPSE